jgi:glycerol kinase
MEYILAIDQGTTSCRALIFNKLAQIVGLAQQEFTQHFPKPGWVEHDAEEIWTKQLAVIKQAIKKANIKAEQIASIGITNQRETTVVWNKKTGKPIYNAIVWQDRRTQNFCQNLKLKKLEKEFTTKTGLVLDPYFSGTKIHWILNNVKGAKALAAKGELCFGTIDTWLVYKLSGHQLHITDATNASRTLLMNLKTCQWDAQLCKYLQVPINMLPTIANSSEVYGKTESSILGTAIPIGGIAGDQQAALYGQQCFKPGMVKNTYGTGCFMLMQTGEKIVYSKNKLLTTVASKINGKAKYALEGSVFVGGAAVQWLRDGLKIIKTSAEVEKLNAEVDDTSGVIVIPAFTGLGAPHWLANAKGAILGLTRGSTGAHIARATLNSIALQSTELLEAMRKDSKIAVSQMRVDGGVVKNNYLMQYQSNLLNSKIIIPIITEVTAMGAAFLAGLAVGYWKNEKELAALFAIDKELKPQKPATWRKQELDKWQQAVEVVKIAASKGV